MASTIAAKLRQRKSFFENEAGAEKFRLRAGDGQIVHRAVHGQFADRSAGKKQAAARQTSRCSWPAGPLGRSKHRGIAQILKRGIAKGRQKQVLDKLVAQLAAAAVAHHDGRVVGERERAATSSRNQACFGLAPLAFQPCAAPVSAASCVLPVLPPTGTVHSCNRPRRRLRLKPWLRPADAAACIPCRTPGTRPA